MHFKVMFHIFLCLLFMCRVQCRPWEIQAIDTPYIGTFVPIIWELDEWAASLLSEPRVPLVGAGAALAYLSYASTLILAGAESKPVSESPRSLGDSSDMLSDISSAMVQEALMRSKSAVVLRRAGARSLQHGATVLRRGLNAFSTAVGAIFTALSTGQRALGSQCVVERMCRIGQMTGMRWPLIGVILRSLESADLDEFARALIDGTTIGDCSAIYPKCPE